ncbi:MAG: asparagine synthase C-terminal domain-containing protein, partial [Acidobacteriota bacterium]
LLAPSIADHLDQQDALDEWLAEPILRFDDPDRGPLGRRLAIDLRGHLVDALLAKVDRMSMACSLEVRVPLLDLELVELAQRLPDHLRLHRGRSKVALRALAARHVPRSAVDRPKEGFSAPLKHWLRGPLRGRMEALLDTDRLRHGGVLNPETVQTLITEHLAGRADHAHPLWAAMVIEDWRERWGASG